MLCHCYDCELCQREDIDKWKCIISDEPCMTDEEVQEKRWCTDFMLDKSYKED